MAIDPVALIKLLIEILPKLGVGAKALVEWIIKLVKEHHANDPKLTDDGDDLGALIAQAEAGYEELCARTSSEA